MNLRSSILAILLASIAYADPAQYGQTIVMPATASKDLKAAVTDAADTLGKVTGRLFAPTTQPASEAIVLLRADSPAAAPADVAALKDKGLEPFVIRAADGRLTITANRDEGLSLGLYWYLQQIGCRWLMPGDNWTVLPQKQDIRITADRLVEPSFKMRTFFGTGGFGPPSAVDPKHTMPARWETWKKRNLFGGQMRLGGHADESFNLARKKIMQEHPEYRALVKGQRVPFTQNSKHCISNPDYLKLYTEERIEAMRRSIKADPTGPSSFAVSVEPDDGAVGFCECTECAKIGNGSIPDRVFFRANHVARELAKELPGRNVSLYAYNAHAGVPSFKLEPNVYVVVIPYAFQMSGLKPEALIAAWGKHVPRMSLYTYWALPDWFNDLPSFNFNQAIKDIRYWHDCHVEGVSNESTHSGGAMGIGLYLASRVLFDVKADDRAALDEFYTLAFGPAREPMQRMLERWCNDFMLTAHELGLSYQDVTRAHELAQNDPAVLARVKDYEEYLHYMRLWYEFTHLPTDSAEKKAKAREMVTYLWRIQDSAMVATFRMTQLITYRYAKDEQLLTDFGFSNKWPGMATITPLTDEELTRLVADGASTYKPMDLALRSYSETLVPLPGTTLSGPGASHSKPLTTGGQFLIEFDAPAGVKELVFKVQVVKRQGNLLPNEAVARDPEGKEILKMELPPDGESRDVSVPIAGPGRYVLDILDRKYTTTVAVPSGVRLAVRKFISTGLSERMYFYVPAGTTRGVIYSQAGIIRQYFKVLDPDGQPVAYELKGPLILFDIPANQAGKPWSLAGFKGWQALRMMNLPQSFSYFPDTLLVPVDALGQP